jgi:hypothetical protein
VFWATGEKGSTTWDDVIFSQIYANRYQNELVDDGLGGLVCSLENRRREGSASSKGIVIFNVMSDVKICVEDILDIDKDVGADL